MKRLALLALLAATPASAEIEVAFREGAPKDRFTIRNLSACALSNATVTIDLEGSAGGLIFDTTATGAGVEVFQPFEIVEGADALRSQPSVGDGDRSVSLGIDTLPAGGAIAFTIDVDDTGGAREITVDGSELAGARVKVVADASREAATFGAVPKARVSTPACD